MKIEIKNCYTDAIILCGEYESIKDCLEKNRGANLDGAYLGGANLDGAYLEGAYLRGAYLEGANLGGANLRGANLGGANLDGAYLEGAYLRGAYLGGAYLEGAKGIVLPIITIAGSRHEFYYRNGKIQIGCNILTVDEWLKQSESLGKSSEYTDKEIAEYQQYIKLVDALVKANR